MVRRLPIDDPSILDLDPVSDDDVIPAFLGGADSARRLRAVILAAYMARAMPITDGQTVSPLSLGTQDPTDATTLLQDAADAAYEQNRALLIPRTGTTWKGAGLDIRVPVYLQGDMALTAGQAQTTPLMTLTGVEAFYGQGGKLSGAAVSGTVSNLHGLVKVVQSPRLQFQGLNIGRTYYGAVIIDEESPDVVFLGGKMKDIHKHCIVDRSGGARAIGVDFYGVGFGDGHVIRYGSFATDTNWMVPHRGGLVLGCKFRYCSGNGVLCETDSERILIALNDYAVGPNFVKADKASRVSDVTMIGNVEADLNNGGVWDPDTQTWSAGATTLSAAALSVAGMQYIGNKQYNCGRRCDFGADAVVEGNYWESCGDGTELVRFVSDEGVGGVFSRNAGTDLLGYINLANTSNVTVDGNRRMTFASGKTAMRIGGDGHKVRRNNFISAGGTAKGLDIISTTTNLDATDNDVSTFSTPISYGVAATVTSNSILDNGSTSNSPIPTVVIAAGVGTVGRVRKLRIDTEASAATDDLDTLTMTDPPIGWTVRIESAVNSRDTTLKNGTGNLALASDCTLATTSNWIVLLWTGSVWKELARG